MSIGAQRDSNFAIFDPTELVLPTARRVAEGPAPRFGDFPRWDLTAAGLPPNRNAAQATISFNDTPDDWVTNAKTLAMAMYQPTHPVVRAAGIYRSNRPHKIKTIQIIMFELRCLAKWASAQGLASDLATWPGSDCERYLDHVQSTRAVSALHSAKDLFRHLTDFGALFPNGGLQTLIGTSNSGRTSTGVTTSVIPPDTFWPLVRACWTYLDVFAPNIITARDELAELDANDSAQLKLDSRAIDDAIKAWLASPEGFVPLHTYTLGRGRVGTINWDGLALCTSPRLKACNFYGHRGATRRQFVQDALEAGFPTRYGFTHTQPTEVGRPDGTRGPWTKGLDRVTVSIELTQIRNAAYIFVAIMTMMRDSEVQGIAPGAVTTHFGAPAVESVLHKGKQGAGVRQRWWISPPVARALEIAAQVTNDPERIFCSRVAGHSRDLVGFDQYEQIRSFVGWVNGNSPENGLQPIPATNLAPHMFRRTMAVITANEPDGEIALGITLKHNAIRALANITTSGYGAPTPEWANEFEHQAKEAAAGEIVADWAHHNRGVKTLRGPGATAFINGLDDVTERAATTAAIGDERMLRNLLRDEFTTIRLGTLNHCLGDPAKSLCVEGATAAVKANGPIPSMCQPATCRNSVITDKHLPIWQHEEADLVQKLKDKNMAAVHRKRLEVQLADVRKITRQDPK
jgi:hypothetical protein